MIWYIYNFGKAVISLDQKLTCTNCQAVRVRKADGTEETVWVCDNCGTENTVPVDMNPVVLGDTGAPAAAAATPAAPIAPTPVDPTQPVQ